MKKRWYYPAEYLSPWAQLTGNNGQCHLVSPKPSPFCLQFWAWRARSYSSWFPVITAEQRLQRSVGKLQNSAQLQPAALEKQTKGLSCISSILKSCALLEGGVPEWSPGPETTASDCQDPKALYVLCCCVGPVRALAKTLHRLLRYSELISMGYMVRDRG